MNQQRRSTICLNMIVKDETPVIQRCLGSLKRFIDYWVIVDTGSSDGTQAMIKDFMQDVPGELLERPWVDFAHNRSEALEAARGKANYVFIIDADEVLAIEPDFALPELDKDLYLIEMLSGGVSYWKQQLVNNKLHWRYKSVLHEYLYCSEAQSEGQLKGVRILRYTDGARSRDPLTYRKDALILENALLEEPDNDRYVFYLAQSYRDANELELSIKHYRRRVKMGRWVEEVWYSLYQIAELQHRLNRDWPVVMEAYLQAFQYRPIRAEPLFKIAMHYQHNGEHPLAFLFLRRAIELPYPKDERLFVEKSVYDFLVPMEYAVSAYWVGEHAEAIRVNNALLCSEGVPPEILDQVIKNRKYSLDLRQPRAEIDNPLREKIKVCIPFHNPGPFLDNCISSLFDQDYDPVEMVFIDDASTDEAAAKVPVEDPRVTLVRNEEREGTARVLHRFLTEHCAPDDIVVVVDGEDWLENAGSFSDVNRFFQEHGCRVMYGQFRYSSGHYGLAMPFPDEASFRMLRHEWYHPYLRAFRAGLYQQIGQQDPDYACMKDARGRWLTDAADAALMNALLEIAGFESVYFNDQVLYVYNLDGPHNQQREQAIRDYLEQMNSPLLKSVAHHA